MSLFNYIIPLIVTLGVLILIHELGHYLVARCCGVKVLRFSVGFGRPLLKYRGTGETEWVLAAFPLGGYVKMLGESEDEDGIEEHELHRAFNRQPVGRRFAIVAAGPVFNLLLAVVLYWGLFVGGSDELRPLIAPAGMETSLAREAGVREGDLVLGIDGNEIKSWQDLRWALLRHAVERDEVHLLVRTQAGEEAVRILDLRNFSLDGVGEEDPIFRMGLRPASPPALIDYVKEGGAAARGGLAAGDEIVAIDDETMDLTRIIETVRAAPGQVRMFTVRREGGERTFSVTIGEKKIEDGRMAGVIDVRFDTSSLIAKVSYGPLDAFVRAARQTWEISAFTLKSIGQMILGKISLKNVSGPITIADIAGKTAQHGAVAFIRFLALISISLGILNLLPIPVLDGGHLLYYAVEFIKGSALSRRVVEVGQKIGLAILFMLMVFALYNDINRLIF